MTWRAFLTNIWKKVISDKLMKLTLHTIVWKGTLIVWTLRFRWTLRKRALNIISFWKYWKENARWLLKRRLKYVRSEHYANFNWYNQNCKISKYVLKFWLTLNKFSYSPACVATGSRLYNALPLKMASLLWKASIVKNRCKSN
jgi:hypothetical protein